MNENEWVYNVPDEEKLKKYLDNGVSPILATVLVNRGMDYEDFKSVCDDFWAMDDEYKANVLNCKAVAKAMLSVMFDPDYKVFVFTDYDADGITSGAIMNVFLGALCKIFGFDKSKYSIYIPERKEGYGISMAYCNEVVNAFLSEPEGTKYLVITFDNGITKNEEIKMLKDAGIQTIVTDHHEPGKILPDADYILDPKSAPDRYGEELCGAGIAWLLASAMFDLIANTEATSDYFEDLVEPLKNCLVLASIGTIADMMQMSKYNLALVKKGLGLIDEDIYFPVACLKKLGRIREMTAKDIGFSLGPMLNACSQMGDVKTAFELFTLEDDAEIEAQADKVFRIYKENQKITKEAKALMEAELERGAFEDMKFPVYIMKGNHPGIVGKVANQLSQDTYKPAVVLLDNADAANEIGGSARCPNPSVNMLDLLRTLVEKGLIKSAAGHQAACGVVFYKDKLDEAVKLLDEMISVLETENVITYVPKVVNIDKSISIRELSVNTFKNVIQIPYSMNFANPVFELYCDLTAVTPSANNSKNIKYSLSDNGYKLDIWAWNIKPDLYKPYHKKIRIAGNMERNFLNPNYITLHVVDIKFE